MKSRIKNGGVQPEHVEGKDVFRGIRMEEPQRLNQIERCYTNYCKVITRRLGKCHVEELIIQEDQVQFRKDAIPNVIEGINPPSIRKFVAEKYRMNKKWYLHEVLN